MAAVRPIAASGPAARAARFRAPTRFVAAALAFAAQGIHPSVLPNHDRVWWGYGAFFLAVAMAQGLLGAQLLFDDPGPVILRLGVLFHLALVGGWALTRVGAIPLRNPSVPLAVEGVDLAAAIVGLAFAAVLGTLAALPAPASSGRR